jgi:uncharacterized protein (TIGR02301 family)
MKPIFQPFRAGALVTLLLLTPAAAQAPYDPQLIRLAEVLGSVHFLRNLCGESESTWREQMEALIQAEAPSEERKAKLIASFNHGYRSFASIYTTCTDSALRAIERYMKEGETLTSEIAMRYGN